MLGLITLAESSGAGGSGSGSGSATPSRKQIIDGQVCARAVRDGSVHVQKHAAPGGLQRGLPQPQPRQSCNPPHLARSNGSSRWP
jgi:hypothetical protein